MSSNVIQCILVGWLIVVAAGVLLGVNNRIVVFRNYNDMAIAFCAGLLASVAVVLWFGFEKQYAILALSLVVMASIGVFWSIIRSFVDNRNPFYAIIAVTTKLTLFALFIFSLVDLVAPSGKTAGDRAAARRYSFIILLFIAPLTYALVKDKTGVFSPEGLRIRRRS
jgi:hypothetical protein